MQGTYINLRCEMTRRNISLDEIADALCIHRNSAANKVNGNSSFSIDEAFLLRDTKFPGMEIGYLFRKFPTEEKKGV